MLTQWKERLKTQKTHLIALYFILQTRCFHILNPEYKVCCLNAQAEFSHLFYLFILKSGWGKSACANKTHLKTSLNMLWNTTYFVLMILRN